MKNNHLKHRLRNNELALGGWVQIGHPATAEIMAQAGMDWICVDLEHGAIDLEMMTHIFRTVDAFDCVPVARLPLNDPIWIHRALDAGARGLIIPMVNTAQEAEAAVREAMYPPRGVRGFGYSRANMHGMDFEDYISRCNDELVLVMQIEHKDALENLDAILEVPDVDGLFIGPLDLSGSMGLTGQMDHPRVIESLDHYRKACQAHNKPAGMHIVRPDETNVRSMIDNGYTLIALGLDNVFIAEGAQAALRYAGR
jgi:2-keto-3-deoxy-L-rhamnonate aldolase RhmA